MGGRAKRQDAPCWRGKGDTTPYVPGSPAAIPRARSLGALFRQMVCCTRCDLAPGRTQVVPGAGAAQARAMLIGEAPGAGEDRAGAPFVGASGKLLDRLLEENGIARNDVFITNVVACRPPGNRTPKPAEVRAHAGWLEEQLRLVAPEIVVTLGRVALIYFLPGARITQLRGQAQRLADPPRDFLLLPTLHPAAVLRRRELLPGLEADFAQLGGLLRKRG